MKFATLATNAISPANMNRRDIVVVTTMATHGVLLEACTLANMPGRANESAIPYIILDEPSIIRSTVLAVEKSAITVKSVKASFPNTL